MTLARRAAEPGSFSSFKRRSKRLAQRPRLPRRREDPVTSVVYGLVMNRDGGCLMRGVTPCRGRPHWHHRVKVEHGGPSIVANGATLCDHHHTRVHAAQPETVGRGLLLTRHDNPATTPVMLYDGRRVLLTADGRYEEAT